MGAMDKHNPERITALEEQSRGLRMEAAKSAAKQAPPGGRVGCRAQPTPCGDMSILIFHALSGNASSTSPLYRVPFKFHSQPGT